MASTFSGAFSWLIAAAIFGSTPTLCFLALRWLSSPSLVVVLQGGIASLCCLGYLLWQICTANSRDKPFFFRSLNWCDTLLHGVIRGFIHVFVPFYLGALGISFLPPAMFGVFMVASIWLKWLLERIVRVKVPTPITSAGFFGLILGVSGISLSLLPVIYKATRPCGNDTIQGKSNHYFYALKDIPNVFPYAFSYPYVNCYSYKQVLFGVLCLFGSSFFWAISRVHWAAVRNKLHYSAVQFVQNVVASLIALVIWAPLVYYSIVDTPTWDYSEGAVAMVILGVFTGWLGPRLVHYLSTRQDLPSACQYAATIPLIAFIEDCLFIRDVLTTSRWMVAVDTLGILLVCSGIYLSNARKEIAISREVLYQQLIGDSPHDYLKAYRPGAKTEDADGTDEEIYYGFKKDDRYRTVSFPG